MYSRDIITNNNQHRILKPRGIGIKMNYGLEKKNILPIYFIQSHYII